MDTKRNIWVKSLKRVIIRFNEDGTTTVEAEGFKGGSCVTETDRLLKPLNAEVKQRRMKVQHHVKVKQKNTIKIH